jgi:hypothetical protein
MRLFKLAAAIGIGACFAIPASTVSAGFGDTSMVINIEETTVELGQDAVITVALQSVSVGSCEMEGDLELVLNGTALTPVELLDTVAAGVNEYTFAIEMTTLGDQTINANFTPRDIELPNIGSCLAPGLQLDQIITVVPASTTTSVEQESTTTSSEVPESVEDSVTATLVKAGASNGNSLGVAAMNLIAAGVGFALIRRRT